MRLFPVACESIKQLHYDTFLACVALVYHHHHPLLRTHLALVQVQDGRVLHEPGCTEIKVDCRLAQINRVSTTATVRCIAHSPHPVEFPHLVVEPVSRGNGIHDCLN